MDYGVEFWEEEFFILDDEAFCGEIDEDFAEGYISEILELRNVNEICLREIILVHDHKFAADFVALGGVVAKLIVIDAHLLFILIFYSISSDYT